MKGCILPFAKKGNLRITKNYRGITLTDIGAKVYNIYHISYPTHNQENSKEKSEQLFKKSLHNLRF